VTARVNPASPMAALAYDPFEAITPVPQGEAVDRRHQDA